MPLEKTFDAASAEPRLYADWEASGCFRPGAGARDGADPFTIMLPPPNVTGFLHVGHAFSQTLMDILIRWKRMQGFDTLWQPGLDHAGIATQLVVEKQLAETGNPSRADLGRQAFLAKVWNWKQTSGGMIEQQSRRLGNSMDWTRSAFTMSGADNAPEGEEGNFHDAVLRVFVDMFEKGYIYRGKRLVNWDPHFETAISDLEVENTEVPGHMWHFKYPLANGATYDYVEKDEDGNETLRETRDYISIATTRPETMLGDGAVAVNPSDERYASIVGMLCEIPVGPKEHRRLIPIITDPYPDPAFGSGAVKITGAHDFNDYEVAKRGNIPMYGLMDTRGAMRSDGRPYAEEAAVAGRIARGEEDFDEGKIAAMNLVPDAYRGLDRFEARERVVADITAEGLAVMVPESDPRLGRKSAASAPPKGGAQDGMPTDSFEEGGTPPELALVPLVEAKPIMQPFGDRSKVVIEPMLTDQWFVDTDKIVGPALEAVKTGRVKIMPESGEKVFFHWLENIEPWCISRQLWWGHQIPVWYGPAEAQGYIDDKGVVRVESRYDPSTDKAFCAATEAEALTMAAAHYDLPVRVSTEEDDISDGDEVVLYRDPDVLDTWFSSGLWPFGTLGWPEDTADLKRYFPGDVLVTGQDILFFWVARMMMMSQAVLGEDPFHTVYLHQLVRDAKGEKMSKTRGNVIDPLEMIDTFGADALRMANAQMAALGGVLKIDQKRIEGSRNFGTKLWNAARFAEMNGAFDAPRVATADLKPQQAVNRWIIGETARIRETVDAALTAYRFNDAANALYAFTWGRVCDWYLELSKPLLMDGTEAEKAETRATLAWVLDQCFILLHPIMPFITEELWGLTATRDDKIVLTDWPTYTAADLADAEADASISWTIQMIEATRSARAQVNVPAGMQVPMLQLGADAAATAALQANDAMIKRLARIDTITPATEAPKGSITIAAPGATFALPLADLIDVASEKTRISKSLDKLDKEIRGLEGRLKNPNFAASAPPEIVAEAEANLAARLEERGKLQTAHDSLAEIA